MPIHMGIKYDVCQTEHFVATSRSVRLRESVESSVDSVRITAAHSFLIASALR